MCKVSIILPTFNRKHCIKKAVESVLRQTWQDFELLIVDDASTDGTEEYVRLFPDGQINYIKLSQNVGASGARNIGIRNARGKYIAFQDSDTQWTDTKLELQVAYMEKADPSVAMVYSPYKRIYQDYSIVYPSFDVPLEEKSGDILPFLLEHPLVDTPTMLVRRSVLDELDGFDDSMRALVDYDLSIRIAQRYRIEIIDEILLLSHHEGDSISNDAAGHIRSSFYILKKHRALFEQYGMSVAFLNQLAEYAMQYQQLELYMECLQQQFIKD